MTNDTSVEFGLTVKTVSAISIIILTAALAMTFYNLYNYVWKKKLYAVIAMALTYLCILFTLICRIISFVFVCRLEFNQKKNFYSVNLSQIGFIFLTIIQCNNMHGIIVSLSQLKGLSDNSTWFLKLKKCLTIITVSLTLITTMYCILMCMLYKKTLPLLMILFYGLWVYFSCIGLYLYKVMR